MKTIEYRVRPVTRYIVTRFAQSEHTGDCREIGEFPNEKAAQFVADRLQSAEHQEAGSSAPYAEEVRAEKS